MTHNYLLLHVYLENGCMGDNLPQKKEDSWPVAPHTLKRSLKTGFVDVFLLTGSFYLLILQQKMTFSLPVANQEKG